MLSRAAVSSNNPRERTVIKRAAKNIHHDVSDKSIFVPQNAKLLLFD
jgi:hypothetical protein